MADPTQLLAGTFFDAESLGSAQRLLISPVRSKGSCFLFISGRTPGLPARLSAPCPCGLVAVSDPTSEKSLEKRRQEGGRPGHFLINSKMACYFNLPFRNRTITRTEATPPPHTFGGRCTCDDDKASQHGPLSLAPVDRCGSQYTILKKKGKKSRGSTTPG